MTSGMKGSRSGITGEAENEIWRMTFSIDKLDLAVQKKKKRFRSLSHQPWEHDHMTQCVFFAVATSLSKLQLVPSVLPSSNLHPQAPGQ